MKGNVVLGPDLNDSKPPLDKKLFRQILLPNGLRAVLVSDTVAMHQAPPGGYYDGHDDCSEESSDEEDKQHNHMEKNGHGDADDESECEEEEEEEGLREAAAALVVGVGSMYDPPEAQGMAHFLEHM